MKIKSSRIATNLTNPANLLATVVAMATLLISCGDDPVSSTVSSMKAEIAGEEWNASSVTMQTTQGSDPAYLIFGSRPDDFSISLRLPADIRPGIDYDPGLEDYDITIVDLTNTAVVYTLTSGGITIDENSGERITGAFDCTIIPANGTAGDQIRVLNGAFVVVK